VHICFVGKEENTGIALNIDFFILCLTINKEFKFYYTKCKAENALSTDTLGAWVASIKCERSHRRTHTYKKTGLPKISDQSSQRETRQKGLDLRKTAFERNTFEGVCSLPILIVFVEERLFRDTLK